MKDVKKSEIKNLPQVPGVYIFKDKKGQILYIGKAANLRKRVKDHFQTKSFRDSLFADKVEKISFIETDSEVEAFILESKLIKKYLPKFNVMLKDSSNYFYVGYTKDDFPTILITHQPDKIKNNCKKITGPFVEGKSLKKVLHFLRKIFPYRMCPLNRKTPCSWYYIDQCEYCKIKDKSSKTKESEIKKACKKNVKTIFKILEGGYKSVINQLRKQMKKAVESQNFEKAIELRDALIALEKIMENAQVIKLDDIKKEGNKDYQKIEKYLQELFQTKKPVKRIEGYDISNIQGKMATGSMVCFVNGLPSKKDYRIFKIKTLQTPNDFGMIKEVLERRFKHQEWGLPDLIIIDGGKGQLGVGIEVLKKYNLENKILISAIAKRKNELFVPHKKTSILLKDMPDEVRRMILHIRDESHRFSRKLHFKIREKNIIKD
ncbi:UvrABC system protein C [bacterium HR34]|nr:UvrABC system protein C [bacterium HR34]